MGKGNPNFETLDLNPHIGGLGRIFCDHCGVIMMTAVFARARSVFNNGDQDKEMVCVFPSACAEKPSKSVQAWQPNLHVNCQSANVPTSALNDGLVSWPELVEGSHGLVTRDLKTVPSE